MRFIALILYLLVGYSAKTQCLEAQSELYSSGKISKYLQYESTGNVGLDYLFEQQIRLGLVIFSLEAVDLYFYIDNFNSNAFAFNRPGLDAISFELGLIREKRGEYPQKPDQPCIAIIAHELGHILQYSREGVAGLKEFQKELHADFLAGYFMGYKCQIEKADYADAEIFFDLFFKLGDDHFFSESHHGTPEQRKRTALAGYRLGRKMTPIDIAYTTGIEYVSQILLKDGK